MADVVETMAWTGTPPWQGLGKKVNNNLTPQQMVKAAGLDWKVEKRPLCFHVGDEIHKVPGKFALARASDHKLLTIVGTTYKPVQNETAMDFFKKFVDAGKMKMETAGSLHGGQYIWALARIGPDFKIGKGDDIQPFLLLVQPHVIGKAMIIQFTPVREVCWNTLPYNLGSNLRGRKGSFRMVHSIEFNDEVKAKAELAVGLAMVQLDEFKQAAQLLSKKKVDAKTVDTYFCDVLGFDHKTAVKKKPRGKKKNEDAVIEPRMLTLLREALVRAPGATLPTAQGTWWGAVNAVTYIVDHRVGRDQSASLRTAWLGQKAILKRRAVTLALERAK